ncbi:MAG: RNase adapter RapZ [Oscillospiraceae bacterium]|nr:RNase adapter RapZ [Oscillospiraceae bacterium]
MMDLILVTGMAGAGKTSAMDALEDIGYYAVDNLPLPMLEHFLQLCREKGGRYSRSAVVIDLRSCHRYSELVEIYRNLQVKYQGEIQLQMMCLEASVDVLLKRFRTSRRGHPVATRKFEGDLEAAIRFEDNQLQVIRANADYILDSSLITAAQLKDQVKMHFVQRITDAMPIQVMSFGFKYGAPMEADLVYDMRCLPNPYYVDDLKNHTGVEKCVQDYVMDSDDSKEYFNKITDMLKFLIPLYIREGRPQLVVAFGCTGGQHRSVTFAELVSQELKNQNMHVSTHHRDYKKNRSN